MKIRQQRLFSCPGYDDRYVP